MSTSFDLRRAPRWPFLSAVLLAVCLLAPNAHAAGTGPAPARVVALGFSLTDAPGAKPQAATLTCLASWANATGYLRDTRAQACRLARQLASSLLTAPDPDRLCTQIFGGPQTATVQGRIDGRWIRRAFSRRNGCDIADWAQMGLLLAPPASTASGQLVDYRRSGGFAGFDDRLTVSASGVAVHTRLSGNPRVFRVSAADLAGIERALAAAEFGSLHPAYLPDTPIADGFAYTITHLGRTVVTSDGAVPGRLAPVIAELDRLLAPDFAVTAPAA